MKRLMGRKQFKQAGLSLIELMIAMSIGIVVSSAVLQVYVSIKNSSRVLDLKSQMQDNARFTLKFIGDSVQMSGFRPDLTVQFDEDFPPVTEMVAGDGPGAPDTTREVFSKGQVILGVEKAEADSVAGTPATMESISVRYKGYYDQLTTDCLGNSIPFSSFVVVRYFLDDCGNLQCQVNSDSPVALVSGVDVLEIEYGVDTTGELAVSTYLDADEVTDWDSVMAVRLSALISSGIEDRSISSTRSYQVSGETHTFSDGILRDVYTKTVVLKNKMK